MVDVVLLAILVFVIVASFMLRQRRIDTSNELIVYQPNSLLGRLQSLTKRVFFKIAVITVIFFAFGIVKYYDTKAVKEASNSLVMVSIRNQEILKAKRTLDSLNLAGIPIKNREKLDSIVNVNLYDFSKQKLNELILLHGSNWHYYTYTEEQASGIISVSNTLLGNGLVSDELTLRRIHSVRGLSFLAKGNFDSAAAEFTKALSIQVPDSISISINWNSEDTRFSFRDGQVPIRSDELTLFRAFANYFNAPIGPKEGFCQDIQLARSMTEIESNVERLSVIKFEFSSMQKFLIGSPPWVSSRAAEHGWLCNPGLLTLVKVEPSIGLNEDLTCE